MELVSIVVPVYNVERYLKRCLDSIIHQTYSNLEIIIVNDGSSDNSEEICLEYKARDSRIIYLVQENSGLSAARNTGMNVASGKYIYFIDSDDYINQYTIKVLVDIACNYSLPVVTGWYENVYEDTVSIDEEPDCKCKIMSSEDFFLQKISNHAWNKLYLRTLFDDVKYPEGKNYEDIATTYKIFSKIEKFGFINFPFYKYYMRSDAISKTFSKKNAEDIIWAYKQVNRDIRLINISDSSQKYYLLTILMAINKVLMNLPDDYKDYRKEMNEFVRGEFNKNFRLLELIKVSDKLMLVKMILFNLNILNLIRR